MKRVIFRIANRRRELEVQLWDGFPQWWMNYNWHWQCRECGRRSPTWKHPSAVVFSATLHLNANHPTEE